MNIKTKNWKDLLNDEPFQRKDIITLQDPTNLSKFNIAKFHHVVKKIKVFDPGRILIYFYFTKFKLFLLLYLILFRRRSSI